MHFSVILKGWSAAYLIEALIIQITATLGRGNSRIDFDAPKDSYNYESAKLNFKRLMKYHEKMGWHGGKKS